MTSGLPVELFECTLRDGSYPISFQFTAEDTVHIARALDRAGFQRIEIGHGIGMGASSTLPSATAAATDREYLEAARKAVTQGAYGMFFIPGIGTNQDVELAAELGASFIRIGTDVTKTREAIPFIEQAKSLGLEVFSNFMKTYACPPAEIARLGLELKSAGSDFMVIVDSAGGMLPNTVKDYVRCLVEVVGLPVSFHGHNNLQLAVGNSLAAVDAGASMIDCTMRGMGRSTGNAQTESVLLALDRMGRAPDIDIFTCLDIGENRIAPIAKGYGVGSLEAVIGYAQFHSSFLAKAMDVAQGQDIDVRRLIIRACETSLVTLEDDVLSESATFVRRATEEQAEAGIYPPAIVIAPPSFEALVEQKLKQLHVMAAKQQKQKVLTICLSSHHGVSRFPYTRAGAGFVVASAECASIEDAMLVARAVEDEVTILCDTGANRDLLNQVKQAVDNTVLPYLDHEVLVRSAFAQVELRNPEPHCVFISSPSPVATQLHSRLVASGLGPAFLSSGDIDVPASMPDPDRPAIVLMTGSDPTNLPTDLPESLHPDSQVLLLELGSVDGTLVEDLSERGIEITRIDSRPGLLSEISTILQTRHLVERVAGRADVQGVPVVAGGVLGRRGDVVMDDVLFPALVIGVSDGQGGLLPESEHAPFEVALGTVRAWLLS